MSSFIDFTGLVKHYGNTLLRTHDGHCVVVCYTLVSILARPEGRALHTLSYVEAVFKDEVTAADRAGKETALQALEKLPPAQRIGVLEVNKHEAFKKGKISSGMIKSSRKNVKQRVEKQEMNADTRDEITRQYFSGKGIKIDGLRSDLEMPGGIVDKGILPSLAGALDGSHIRVDIKKNWIDIESRHALYDRPITYMLDKEGILHGVDFYLSTHAPEGLGTRMMATTLLTALDLGIPEVQLMAAGRPDNGYYTWPRLGFNGVLTEKLRVAAEQSGFYTVNTVLDIMDSPGGKEWWLENGVRMEMKFILDRDSCSMKTLLNYLADKGIRL